jgi:hypothetical protein
VTIHQRAPEDGQSPEVVESLIGATIVAVDWYSVDGGEWSGNGECVLTLADGRRINFCAWGHDAWGLEVVRLNDVPDVSMSPRPPDPT